MDIGGTSMDFSVIETERLVPTNAPTVMGVRLGVRMLETTSIGVAGGSIAWLRQDQVMVGPVSAGSTPGPACYGRGGKQPTVTDANLVLGLIDPAQPLGGRIRVLHSLADDVLDRAIGAPLGVSSIDAAHAIRNVVNSNIASTITEHLREHQIDTTDLALFAFGGGGPLHACAVAELLDVSFVLGADCGSVFCAYASCTLDECQELHESISGATAKPLEAAIQETCRRLWQQAQMLFEGASRPDVDVRYKWNVELAGIDVGSRIEFDEQGGGIRPLDLANWLAGESAQGQQVVGVVLRVTIPASARTDPGDPSTVDCLTGFGDPVKREGVVPHRRIHWDEGSEAVNTPVYDFSQLSEIEPVAGPAIFEGVDTCWVVPQGWVARAGLRRTILLRRP
jgi:N-methylhydantoinase A